MKDNVALRVCSDYCTGCGLCASVKGVSFSEDERRFLQPKLEAEQLPFLKTVCPAMGNALNHCVDGTIWGRYERCALGWAKDEALRHAASSGGVLSALCCYLIESGRVDGVIQTMRDPSDPRRTVTVVSNSAEAVRACCGSRYTASSPLMHIRDLIEPGKKYAYVGKPCDVSALRMWKNEGKEAWTDQILWLFSFFCAGQPSLRANDRLLSALGIDDVAQCADLSYRGNGWPGFATAKKTDGTEQKMDYERSWMTILGRDVRRSCRFCADGVGEQADISCGDAWFLTAEGKPDFTERPGRNVIFARTDPGAKLLQEAVDAGFVAVEPYDPEKDGLKKSQPYHNNRKASLRSLRLAMHLCGRPFPDYSTSRLKQFEKGFPLKQRVLRCLGTVKRVWSKAI